jgi:hypothetical protein
VARAPSSRHRGETEDDQLLKDPEIVKRLKDIDAFSEQEKSQVYFTIDAVIREIKNRRTYAPSKR